MTSYSSLAVGDEAGLVEEDGIVVEEGGEVREFWRVWMIEEEKSIPMK